MSKRTFGSTRKLPSGRYQVRYLKDGIQYVGPTTFETVADADAYLSEIQTEIRKQTWIDPERGSVTFRTYAEQWMDDQVHLRPTTKSLYRILLDKWLLPHVGSASLAAMTKETWKRWFVKVSAVKPGGLQPGKAYKLAHTILNSAVEDRRIVYNPCVVKGAGNEKSPERPVADVSTVTALADAIDPEYRALVLVAAYAALRFGEAAGLRRRHVDLMHNRIIIEEQAIELADGSVIFGEPKTEAGKRMVSLPDEDAVQALREHLDTYVPDKPDALVFTDRNRHTLRRAKFRFRWLRACKAAGATGLHFHDLRHTGLTLAGQAGATEAELMHRAGHRSPAAARRYQHATLERDRMIADRMAEAIRTANTEDEEEHVAEVVAL